MSDFFARAEYQVLIIVAILNLLLAKVFQSPAIALFSSFVFFILSLYLLFYPHAKPKAPLFAVLILGMNTVLLLLLSLLIALKYIIRLKRKTIGKIETFAVLVCIVLILQGIFAGGYLQYNIIRLVTVLVVPLFALSFSDGFFDKLLSNWLTTFVFVYFCNLIYISFFTDEPRSSIFSTSENIALALIFILAVLAALSSSSLVTYLLVLLMYNSYALFFTQSRTAVVFVTFFSLFVFNAILRNNQTGLSRGVRMSLLGFLCLLAFYSVFMFAQSSLVYSLRLDYMFDYLQGGAVQLDTYSETELRGILTLEGLNYFMQKPIFGNGSVSSALLLDLDYSVGKVVSFHNSYIDLLVQFGILGTVLLVVIYVLVFNQFKLLVNFRCDRLSTLLIFSPIALAAYFQPYFFNIRVMMLLGLFIVILRNGQLRIPKASLSVARSPA